MTATLLNDGSAAQARFGFGPTVPGQIINAASLRWLVPVYDLQAAINYNTVDPAFPKIGSQHPSISTMYCSQISGEQRVGNQWYVRTDYTLPEALSAPQPQPDRTNPYFKAIETATTTRRLTIPYFLKVQVQSPNAVGPVLPIYTYEEKSRTASYQGTELTVSLNVQSWTFANVLQVQQEVGTVHLFPNGGKYLFLGCSSRRTAAAGYTLTYRWVTEPDPLFTAMELGTLMPDAANIQFFQATPNGMPAFFRFDVRYDATTRTPYVIIDSDYPTAYAPTNGYTSLPGNPIS